MTQEKPKSDELVVKESRTRILAYTPEFKNEIVVSPRAIKKFLELRAKLEKVGDKSGTEGFSVEFFGSWKGVKYYRLMTTDSSYFIKETPQNIRYRGGGVVEIKSLRKVRDILKKNNISWAETVDFKLGYEDKDKMFFISKWQNRLQFTVDGYKKIMKHVLAINSDSKTWTTTEAWQELEEIDKKMNELGELLGQSFGDFTQYNVSYDPNLKKFYIFDLKLK